MVLGGVFYDLRRKMKKYKIITVKTKKRVDADSFGVDNHQFLNAYPCTECAQFMRRYGIRKIYYSTPDGIKKLNLNQCCDEDFKLTDAQVLFRKERNDKLSRKKKKKGKKDKKKKKSRKKTR